MRRLLTEQFKSGKRSKIAFKCNWIGRTHRLETIEKIKASKKGQGVGKTNSQYGTCWMTKDGINIKIKRDDVDKFSLDGWKTGRHVKTIILANEL